MELADSAGLVRGVARDADVVVALQDQLDVAEFEGGRLAQLGETAGARNDRVDEVVGKLEHCLFGR